MKLSVALASSPFLPKPARELVGYRVKLTGGNYVSLSCGFRRKPKPLRSKGVARLLQARYPKGATVLLTVYRTRKP